MRLRWRARRSCSSRSLATFLGRSDFFRFMLSIFLQDVLPVVVPAFIGSFAEMLAAMLLFRGATTFCTNPPHVQGESSVFDLSFSSHSYVQGKRPPFANTLAYRTAGRICSPLV